MSEEDRLLEEARAFDKRVLERVQNGLVPDLDNAADVDWFYNNPWRRKLYVDFVFGDYFKFAMQHIGSERQRVLEIGSGLGHMCLQLARRGHVVTGLELSSVSVEVASRYYQSLPPSGRGNGEVEYINADIMSWDPIRKFDTVCFFLTLHHFQSPSEILRKVRSIMTEKGKIIVIEPARDLFSRRNALIAYLMRQLMSFGGNWYEKISPPDSVSEIDRRVDDVLLEYQEAKERNEREQSPNDNSTYSKIMLEALRENFQQVELKFGNTFLPRLIGGIRASDSEREREMAFFLKRFDEFATANELVDPGVFYFSGKI